MRNLYLANGFSAGGGSMAQVLDNYRGREGDLLIHFVVQEGKQTRVAALKIEGGPRFSRSRTAGTDWIDAGAAVLGIQRGHGSRQYTGAVF